MPERLGGEPLAGRQVEAVRRDGGEDVAVPVGEVTTATDGWFLAAARTIEGPPMSICSTHSSGAAPDATVASNG